MTLIPETRAERRRKRKFLNCPICKSEIKKDLLIYFAHLKSEHFPELKYINGHFISYDKNGKLLDQKTRVLLERIAVNILIWQKDTHLKRRKSTDLNLIEKCSNCKISKSFLMKYVIDGKYEFLFCEKCKRNVLKKENFVRIIYNPTGQGKGR